MKKTMQDSSGSRQDSWSKMRDIHEQSSAKIREVLTDEQKTKYDKMQEERRQRGQQRRQNHEEAPPSNPQ
jgi:Spy/CpxP family protein refolding chaperone